MDDIHPNRLAFSKLHDARALECGRMHEHILPPSEGATKPKPLVALYR